jgi:uncharacterized protein
MPQKSPTQDNIFLITYQKVIQKITNSPLTQISIITLLVMAPLGLALLKVGNIGFMFDTTYMAQEHTTPAQKKLEQQFLATRKNTQLFFQKSAGAFTQRELCQIKKAVATIPSEYRVIKRESLFQFSKPYSKNSKLLFRPILDLNCHELSQQNLFSILKQYPLLDDFYHLVPSDLLYTLHFDDKTQVDRVIPKLEQWLQAKLPQFTIYTEGEATITSYIAQNLFKDIKINIFIILLFLALFKLIFSSVRNGVTFFLTTLPPLAIVIVILEQFAIKITPLTASIFILMIIAAIQDYLFITIHRCQSGCWQKSLAKYVIPSFFTSATTMIGFGSLALSPILELQTFGLVTATAALLEWISLFFIFPAIVAVAPNLVPSSPLQLNAPLKRLAAHTPHRITVRLSLIFFFLGVAAFGQLEVREQITSFFKSDHPIHQHQEYFSQTRGWLRTIQVAVPNEIESGPLLNKFHKIPHVNKVTGYPLFWKFITSELTPMAARYVKSELRNSSLLKQLKSSTHYVVVLKIDSDELQVIQQVLEKTKEICQQTSCTPFGRMTSYANFNSVVLTSLYKSFSASFLLVCIVIMALQLYRQKRVNLGLIYSAIWGPVTTILLLVIFQIPLNFVSSIFFSVLIGFCGDNAIQYLFHGKQRFKQEELAQIGQVSLIIATFCILGSGLLYFSSFKFTSTLGLIFAAGFLINVFGDLFLLKGLTPLQDSTKRAD